MTNAPQKTAMPRSSFYVKNHTRTTNKVKAYDNQLKLKGKTNGRRRWSMAQRRAQAERARQTKPWLAATGPKSLQGKKRVAKNALKHGLRSAQTMKFRHLLRLQRAFQKKVMQKYKKEMKELKALVKVSFLTEKIMAAIPKTHSREP